MSTFRRTEITVETDQILIIRRTRAIRAWCEDCGCEVDMVDQGEVQAIAGISGQALRDFAGANHWHLSEGQDRTGLVCLESLLKSK
jgi:hypothetical protein